MTELDTFERRLQDRLLAHVAPEGLAFDADALTHAAVMRATDGGVVARWRDALRAWVGMGAGHLPLRVVILAVLAALLVAATIVVGGQLLRPQPSPLIPAERGQFVLTGSMSQDRRHGYTVTLLHDGRVLVVGGHNGGAAEVWDPTTERWSDVGTLAHPREGHTATLLKDGRVLVTGGGSTNDADESIPPAEVWDPSTERWSDAGTLAHPRVGHTATLLADGRVLVTGGESASDAGESLPPEAWDPRTLTFQVVDQSVTEATGGRPLEVTLSIGPDDRAYLLDESGVLRPWDPTRDDLSDGSWRVVAGAVVFEDGVQTNGGAVVLPDGRVLIMGGAEGTGIKHAVDTARIWDPATGRSSPTAAMTLPDSFSGGTTNAVLLLPDGRVLVVHGQAAELFVLE